MSNPPKPALAALLEAYGITRYEATSEHYGNSQRGPLLKLIVWDRFIHDPTEFAALGYALVCRLSDGPIDSVYRVGESNG